MTISFQNAVSFLKTDSWFKIIYIQSLANIKQKTRHMNNTVRPTQKCSVETDLFQTDHVNADCMNSTGL